VNFIFNNTLVGSKIDPTQNNPLYQSTDPFLIFNDPSHKNLVILSRYLLRPAFVALKAQLKSSIDSSLNLFTTIYIILFAVFFAAQIFIYLFIWRPFENGLNQTVICNLTLDI